MSLPPASTLQFLADESLNEVTSLLFEPSETFNELFFPLIHSTSFTTYDELINRIQTVLLSKPTSSTQLLKILSSHPRLGEKKVESAQSRAEQSNLGSADIERNELGELNRLYDETFPGLRYVVFVNARGR